MKRIVTRKMTLGSKHDGGAPSALTVRALFVLATLIAASAGAEEPVAIRRAELHERLLLQISYEREHGRQDFMTSRSRIVTLQKEGPLLRMISEPLDSRTEPRVLATFPVRGETAHEVLVSFDASLIFDEEDRTGEDYYGRIEKRDYSFVRLSHGRILHAARDGRMLVLEQEALTKLGDRVLVHYYLSPYHPSASFEPFEIHNLDRFGFYETYPLQKDGRTVLYAMKFDAHRPIVFALSSAIPASKRQAVRDGVLYWNRALGQHLLEVTDAPEGVTAPSPTYNVIQWVTDGDYASTSHIQSDPLTGEILHAHIFVLPDATPDDSKQAQNDHLRYVVAHEVGHALGLRHNFAKGPISTVMNYFDFETATGIGHDSIAGHGEPLAYDRQVIRHVYLGDPLDLATLPAFCTDNQKGCQPFN